MTKDIEAPPGRRPALASAIRSLATTLAPLGVTVNTVDPGQVIDSEGGFRR
ncbi:hypothetical protein OIM90_29285 [Streptomyces sp. AD16]|nr:hypothetical protein NQP46_03280 [Streptomyces albus]WDV33879.1 hypothetical protein OIM90_29285 [Streptomyces sp. AD16]